MLYVENLGMEDHRVKCNNKSSIYCLVHNNNLLGETSELYRSLSLGIFFQN